MADDIHPNLLPTVDPSRISEPPSTLDANGKLSTFDRQRQSMAHDPAAPTIPGYAITGELARGGMGMVYAAKDLTLDREVAVKTLLPGAPADRFVTESKITARLPHPGIPPVHALGWLGDGTPYLAMKLIRGRTLAELLNERASPSDDVSHFIAVFEQIAQAVGFAHEQGIIHRDLKPLNVMVGAFGEVQVMDWGLAKDLASRELERPESESFGDDLSHTSAGAVMGTPGYMAPEQARGEPADARADVFALGAILAAILTGKPAFVGSTARETIQIAARGDLNETLERLGSSGADAELVVLAKDCLAAESQHRPIDAKLVAKRVADYRLGVEQRLKQAETARAEALVREAEGRKRRRAMQWAAGVVTGVLLAGVVGTSLGMKEARRQEGIAKTESEQAKKNLAFAKKGNEILGSVFASLHPSEIAESGRPLQDVMREQLGRAVEEIEAAALGDSLEVATLQNTLGMSLLGMGDYANAVAVFEKALASRKTALGMDHPDTITSMNNLAAGYNALGKLDMALRLYVEALELRKAMQGADHPLTLKGMNNVATVYREMGKLNLALPLLEETLSIRTAKLGPDHPDTLNSMNNLAQGYKDGGKPDMALPVMEKALASHKAALGIDHPDTLLSMNNLAVGYFDAGELDRAIPMLEETLRLRRTKLGADHPKTLDSMSNLSQAYKVAKKLDAALPLMEETLKLSKGKLGSDHRDTLNRMNNLAQGYKATGNLDLALPLLEETLRLTKGKLGFDHPDTLNCMNNLAQGYKAIGKLDLALPLLEETLKLTKAKLGPDHPDTLVYSNNLASAYQAVGKLNLALPLNEAAVAGVERLRFRHRLAHTFVSNLIICHERLNQFEQAEKWRLKWLAVVKERAGVDSLDYAAELESLGFSLLKRKKWSDARSTLTECLSVLQKKQPDIWSTFDTQSLLGAALLGQKKCADAEPMLLKGYEGMKAREKSIPANRKSRIPEALDRLVELYIATNKPDEVKKWKAERATYPLTETKPPATSKK